MGVNLRDLFPLRDVPDGWMEGRRIAVDGHNVAWRYLASIRGRDGDVLRNKNGRCTSHLIGLLGVVRQFREQGAEPIMVWDGPVHPRKQATVDARRAVREEAVRRADAALAAGDMKEYHRLMRGTVWLGPDMIDDATRMMETLGVAVVTADHDGERYAASLCAAGHADTVATEDYDALVTSTARSTAGRILDWMPAGQRARFADSAGEALGTVSFEDVNGMRAVRVELDFDVSESTPAIFPILTLPLVGEVPPLPARMRASAIALI